MSDVAPSRAQDPISPPRTRPSAVRSPSLPAPPGPLDGRGRDIDAAAALLSHPDTRMLVLTVPGGVGKTRLAVEVARRCAPRFAEGAHVVDLSGVRDADGVLPQVARSLDLATTGVGGLTAALRDQHLLLVLDNLEQVAAAAGDLAELLAACADLKILGTSRVRLHLRGEQVHPVHPLPVPPRGAALDVAAAAEYASVSVRTTPRSPDPMPPPTRPPPGAPLVSAR